MQGVLVVYVNTYIILKVKEIPHIHLHQHDSMPSVILVFVAHGIGHQLVLTIHFVRY
jgi:hypothetical protein